MKRLLSVCALVVLPLGMLAAPARAADFDSTVHIVKDATPGTQKSGADYGVALGSRLIYSYENVTNGTEVWITDGSRAGTRLLKDIVPGSDSSDPNDFTRFGGKVYFHATDATHGDELWVTDGTTAGTKLFRDIEPGPGSSYVGEYQVVAVGSTLYFSARMTSGPNAGAQLWKTDGVAAHTSVVHVIRAGDSTTGIYSLSRWGTRLVFSATDDSGIEPWVTDGTTTLELKDINPGPGDSSPTDFEVVGATLYFVATPTGVGGANKIWHSTYPTVGNLVTAFPLTPSVAITDPGNLTANGSTLWFTAVSGTVGNELWKSDGTDAGTVLAADINPNPGIGSSIETPKAFGSSIYFGAIDSPGNGELWKANSTGVTKVKEINTDAATGSYPGNFVAVGSQLFFGANGPGIGFELYVTDGTANGTKLVKDVAPGSYDSYAEPMVTIGNTLFLSAQTPTTGDELWVYTTKPSTTTGYPKASYTRRVAAQKRIHVTVKVRATGTTPPGKVYLKQGTKVVGAGVLSHGVVSIRITKAWGKGIHLVRAYYAGSVYARTSHSALIRVKVS